MIDESTVELIHADIDGRLPAARRAELSSILLADAEARALHRDMRRLQQQLAAVGAEEAPPGLAESIMAAIPAPATAAGARIPAQSLRYALALAAGVAVVAVVLHIGGLGDDIDGSAAIGTMAAGDRASAPVVFDRREISGSVLLRRTAESVLIDVDVVPHDDVEVTAEQAAGHVSAFVRAGADGERQRLTLELPAGEPGPVSVRFTSRGRVVEELLLDAPAGR